MSAIARLVAWLAAALVAGTLGMLVLNIAASPAIPSAQLEREQAALARMQSLPVQAQSVISTAVGSDTPVFAPTRTAAGYRSAGGGVTARFGAGGVALGSHAGSLSFSSLAVGSGKRLVPLAAGSVSAHGNRVTYDRGAVAEWYAAGPLGIEQGFTVARRPAAVGQRLKVALGLGGELRPEQVGNEAMFVTPSGKVALRYGGLSATDAHGQVLPAGLAVRDGKLLLSVTDANAVYPIRIDPFVQQGGPVTPNDEAGPYGYYGHAVALSADGNTALISADEDGNDSPAHTNNINESPGAAWVFTRTNNVWAQQGPKLAGNPGSSGAQEFGSSVSLSADGNTALIGAWAGDLATFLSTKIGLGSAYVFTRAGGVWTRQTMIQPVNPTDSYGLGINGGFGGEVALSADGTTALVAGDDGSANGQFWVFKRSGASWSSFDQQGAGAYQPSGEGAHGVTSVALSSDGSTALIGSFGVAVGGGFGSAWAFARSGSSWSQQGPALAPTNGSGSEFFGDSVALSGDGNTALVGAPLDGGSAGQGGVVPGPGAAFVFTRSGSTWAQQTKLADPGAVDLGAFVGLTSDGNTAEAAGGIASTGVNGAYEWTRSGAVWTSQGASPLPGVADVSDAALSADGHTIMIGMESSGDGIGTALAFIGSPVSVSLQAVNSTGAAWSAADEGVGRTMNVKVTIRNRADSSNGTANVMPAALAVSPAAALMATGGPAPPVPTGGYSVPPGASVSFTVPYKILTPGQATVSDSVTWTDSGGPAGPSSGTTTVPLGSAVEGTVRNLSCGSGGATGCSSTGLGGATILATGRASDGTAVVRTATSQGDGTYTLGVPAGGYTVGPTQDGKTIDGAGFDPLNRAAVVPAVAPLTGQDFSACALNNREDTAGDRRSAARAASDLVLAHAAAAAATPTACKSIYTIKVSAKIPQPRLVDPSSRAAYQEHGADGYNPSSRHSHPVAFPACFSNFRVQKLSNEGATAEWYSYIKGGKLGSVTASFMWDRKAQETHLVDGPKLSVQKLTRIFVWKVDNHGTITKGTCPETNHVEMLTLPIGGSDDGSGKLAPREFALMTVWGFPFEPTGQRVDPDSLLVRGKGVLQDIYSYVQNFDTAVERTIGTIVTFYKRLPSLVRFGIEFGASAYMGTKIVHVIKAAPVAVEAALAGSKYLPYVLPALKAAGSVAEGLHGLKAAQEIIAYLSGFSDKGEYPVMGAIIRGRFQPTGYYTVPQETGKALYVPTGTALALSAKTTKFPTFSIEVSRQAEQNLDPNNPVKTGPLPWTSGSTPQLNVHNTLSRNPAGEITNAADEHYGIGIHGVHEIHANTSQTPELTKAAEEHAEEFTNFEAELDEDAVPKCDPETFFAIDGSFLCYKFKDGRP
jgi:hypothetical protein